MKTPIGIETYRDAPSACNHYTEEFYWGLVDNTPDLRYHRFFSAGFTPTRAEAVASAKRRRELILQAFPYKDA